jgi:hypothetical protein
MEIPGCGGLVASGLFFAKRREQDKILPIYNN